MKEQHFDYDMIGEVFWQRMAERAPRTRELIDLTAHLFEQIWKSIAIEVGQEAEVEMSVGSDGKLKGSMPGWVVFGLTGIAAYNMAVEQSRKSRDEVVAELRGNLEARLTEIDQRVKNIEEDLGIRKPF